MGVGEYTFSIIIPVYNAGNLLRNSLKSISNQTLADFEIVIVNGDPEDDVSQIIKEFAATELTIQLISEVDKGVYDAMNKGIKISAGKWLYFMGAGDEFYKENTLEMVSKHIKLSLEIIQGDIIIKDYHDKRYADRLDGLILLERNFCHQGIFFNKNVFQKIGDYSLSYPIYADWDFNIRWFFNRSIKRKYVKEVICNYLGGGLSSRNKDNKFLDGKWSIIKNHLLKNLSTINIFLVLSFSILKSLPKRNQRIVKKLLYID